MKIAIIGAGDVGTALGNAWVKAGHEVVYGVRNPKLSSGHVAIEQAVSASDVVVLAVPWLAAARPCPPLSSSALVLAVPTQQAFPVNRQAPAMPARQALFLEPASNTMHRRCASPSPAYPAP